MTSTSTQAPGALASIREFFALRRAEQTVRAYEPEQHRRIQAHTEAARRRLAVGRRTVDDVAAAATLREAVLHSLLATHAARSRDVSREIAGPDLVASLPTLPADPTRPDAVPSDDGRVRGALSARDPLYFDRLSPQDVARTRAALERAAAMLAGRVEARSLINVRATRIGRLAALVVIGVYSIGAAAAAAWLPRNVARDKPVHLSSSRRGDGKELVDGEIATVPGVYTNVEESPSATIDLGDVFAIDQIRVYNRIDHAFDDSLPLDVELSTDGLKFKPLARRDDHFSADPPWIVTVHHEPARFVRVRVLKRGYLALSEVEVYGKKLPVPRGVPRR
jgi:hypothetical protein